MRPTPFRLEAADSQLVSSPLRSSVPCEQAILFSGPTLENIVETIHYISRGSIILMQHEPPQAVAVNDAVRSQMCFQFLEGGFFRTAESVDALFHVPHDEETTPRPPTQPCGDFDLACVGVLKLINE